MFAMQGFTITAEILASSLANFHCQYADRLLIYNLCIAVNERERTI